MNVISIRKATPSATVPTDGLSRELAARRIEECASAEAYSVARESCASNREMRAHASAIRLAALPPLVSSPAAASG